MPALAPSESFEALVVGASAAMAAPDATALELLHVALALPAAAYERIGVAEVVTLGSRCQQHVIARSIDRLTRGADAHRASQRLGLDRDWQFVQR
jgi:hypothetical protein